MLSSAGDSYDPHDYSPPLAQILDWAPPLPETYSLSSHTTILYINKEGCQLYSIERAPLLGL